jgi:hypothetical protein
MIPATAAPAHTSSTICVSDRSVRLPQRVRAWTRRGQVRCPLTRRVIGEAMQSIHKFEHSLLHRSPAAGRERKTFGSFVAVHVVARLHPARVRCATRPIPFRKSLERSRCAIVATHFNRTKDFIAVRPPRRGFNNFAWLAEQRALTTYHRLRDRGRQLFPTQVIRTQKLYHRQVYEFAYHRAKLAFLRDGTLDDKRASATTSTARFSVLADFLESVPHTCPQDLFQIENGAARKLRGILSRSTN